MILKSAAGVRSATLSASTIDSIGRYFHAMRRPVRRFAGEHRRNADLVASFPAAAIAMAFARGSARNLADAQEAIIAGRPLNEIAEALDLPVWIKRFPPESFQRPIPLALTYAPTDSEEHQQFVRRLPANHDQARVWISRLFNAIEKGPHDFALWCCSDRTCMSRGERNVPAVVAAYAFYSANRWHEASKFITLPWSPGMGWTRAVMRATDWYQDLLLGVALNASVPKAAVTEPKPFGGARITPLLTLKQLRIEGLAMSNCISQYWPSVLLGRSLLFRIEGPSGERANFEVMTETDGPVEIAQISGPSNETPSAELALAAHTWVRDALSLRPVEDLRLWLSVDLEIWRELWTPYWEQYGEQPGLSARPTHDELCGTLLSFRHM